jgi:hypothetical protein
MMIKGKHSSLNLFTFFESIFDSCQRQSAEIKNENQKFFKSIKINNDKSI